MNDHSAGNAELPRSAYLEHTLRRARNAAEQRSHRYVTLEHLLFALMDDPDAIQLIRALGADLAAIRAAASDTVNNRMSSLAVPGGRPPSFSDKFDTLFAGASEDAVKLGRRDVDGAFALIAVAKDRESAAAGLLTANGFYPQSAMQSLAGQQAAVSRANPVPAHAPAPPVSPQPQQRPPGSPQQAVQASTSAFQPTPAASSSNSLMEDMLTSVRNILDAEERKDRGGTPPPPPPKIALPQPPSQPRFEPQLRLEAGSEVQSSRNIGPREQHALQVPDRSAVSRNAEPGPLRAGPERRQPPVQGFSAPQGPSFDYGQNLVPETAEKKQKTRDRKKNRIQGESQPLPAKLLEGIPRRIKFGSPVMAEVHLGKEEAAALFARMGRRGQPQLGLEPRAMSRAVTIRLSAPEGGVFAEPLTPETQWIFDRPSFAGEEPFGSWAWTLVPNEKGTVLLNMEISARDIDGSGLAGELKMPVQGFKVRIHGSLWRALAGLLSTTLLLLAGSGLAACVWYALKVAGKLPQ